MSRIRRTKNGPPLNPEQDTSEWDVITRLQKSGKLEAFAPLWVPEPIRVAVLPDIHVPYHSRELLGEALARTREFEPHNIIQIGDLNDAYPISRFNKDPARKLTIRSEGHMARDEVLVPLREQNPNAIIDVIYGNHEQRLDQYVFSRAPELADIPEISWKHFWNANALDINVHPRSGFKRYGLRFKHGDYVASKTGATAHKEMAAHRCSGISGHTHRFGSAEVTDKEGHTTKWLEIGHLCDTAQADYTESPDWQAGMMLLTINPDGSIEEAPVRLT